MNNNFKTGDPVWAKMKRCVPWPARIATPRDYKKATIAAKKRQNLYWVYFFGTHDFAWIEEYNIRPYREHRADLINASKAKTFEAGIQEIEQYIDTRNTYSPTVTNRTYSPATSQGTRKRRSVKRSSTRASQSSKRSRLSYTQESGTDSSASTDSYQDWFDGPVQDRNETSPSDYNDQSESTYVVPSNLTFGFLGLGVMASGMVENLIKTGHQMNLWCDDPAKCEQFKSDFVDVCASASEVVQNSDVTFCCLSSAQAAKQIVQELCTDPDDPLRNKGYVDLSGVDTETSKEIDALLVSKGGRYLEVQLHGNKEEADDGNLILLGAGDETLVEDCFSCFKAIGKMAFHFGDVGVGNEGARASKMNLILHMMHGTALAGLAEGFALAERSGLTLDAVLQIFSLTNLSCPYLYNKAEIIINGKFDKCDHHQSLRSVQKELRLATKLAYSLQQPLLLVSTANEVFKDARQLGYDEHDPAAVFIRALH